MEDFNFSLIDGLTNAESEQRFRDLFQHDWSLFIQYEIWNVTLHQELFCSIAKLAFLLVGANVFIDLNGIDQ